MTEELLVSFSVVSNKFVCLFVVCCLRGRASSVVSPRGHQSSSCLLFVSVRGSHVVRGSFPDPRPLLHSSPLELLLPPPPVSHLLYASVDGARSAALWRRWGHNSPAIGARTHAQLLECCRGRGCISTNGAGCRRGWYCLSSAPPCCGH